MIVREYINVKDDRLIDGLTPVVRIMSQMERSLDLEVTIDFSETRFISPVFALSLIIYLSRCGKQVFYKNAPDYLERIGLANGGIKPDTMRQTEFLAELEKYASKTYIPIIDFAAGRNSDAKEVVSSIVENIIIQQLSLQSNVANGLKYMIDETLDNITEHSESDRGYIFAQAYPTKGFLDVCIADRGVSLLGSYEKLPDNEISSDIEAIKAANRGLSSKNLPDAENRGFGIRTSKQMLIQGLGGQYFAYHIIPLRLTILITLNNMKKIDIAAILSPDLKSRMRAQDLKALIENSGADVVEMDFQGVKFATRSFIDEFYNLFLKTPETNTFRVELINVPSDIKAMLDSVSRTQVRAKVIPSQSQEVAFKDVKEFLNYFSTVVL